MMMVLRFPVTIYEFILISYIITAVLVKLVFIVLGEADGMIFPELFVIVVIISLISRKWNLTGSAIVDNGKVTYTIQSKSVEFLLDNNNVGEIHTGSNLLCMDAPNSIKISDSNIKIYLRHKLKKNY